MPTTRTQTGKLPFRIFPAANLDSEPEDVDDVFADVNESAMTDESKPERFIFETFTTFNSKHHLRDGLSMVRHLGGGKYELVNLQSVDTDIMGCEEVGQYLRSDPKRLEAFEKAQKDIRVSKFTIEQATNSAQFKIFRFLKLPIELRYRVYDFTLSATEVLLWNKNKDKNYKLGLGLRIANRQIYEETAGHFYRNNFRICELAPKTPDVFTPACDAITPYVREITFSWRAFAIKDTQTLKAIAALPQLKVLNLQLTAYCISFDGSRGKQRTHQEDDSIRKFNQTKTFDVLMTIRGLERVVVTKSRIGGPSDAQVSETEIARFEEFLNQELTKPQEPPEDSPKPTGRAKKRKYAKNDSSDDDFEVRKPRRRRRLN